MRLAHLKLVELGLELLHGLLAVAVLGSGRPTDRDDARRNMVDSDGGLRLLNVLTAGARCTEDVHGEVGGVDLDFDRVVDFRVDVHGREGRVAAGVRVEPGSCAQGGGCRFRCEACRRPFALDVERAGLDAGDFARAFFFKGDLEALAFGVAHVHAFEPCSPSPGLGAACACLDFQVAVGRVHRLVEHALESS